MIAPTLIVLAIAGGGWMTDTTGPIGQTPADQMAAYVKQYAPKKATIISVRYRGGGIDSLADVRATYRVIYQAYPRTPIVAYGASAGAQLALMLDSTPGVHLSGVIAEGPPTDLPLLETEGYGALPQDVSWAFPGSSINTLSPINARLRTSKATTLLGRASCDGLIPADQVAKYVAYHSVTHLTLSCPPGPNLLQGVIPSDSDVFAHAFITHSEHNRWKQSVNRVFRDILR